MRRFSHYQLCSYAPKINDPVLLNIFICRYDYNRYSSCIFPADCRIAVQKLSHFGRLSAHFPANLNKLRVRLRSGHSLPIYCVHPICMIPMPVRDYRNFRKRKFLCPDFIVKFFHMRGGMAGIYRQRHLCAAYVTEIRAIFCRVKRKDPHMFADSLQSHFFAHLLPSL